MRLFSRSGLFEVKHVAVRQIFPLAAAYALSTPLSNLSLSYNSVGFYQLMKILTTPYVATVETVFYGAHYTREVKVSLAVVTVGVLLASSHDVEVRVNECSVVVLLKCAVYKGCREASR